MVLGDWGRKGKYGQGRVAECMQWASDNRGVDFIVTTGDNFYNWGVPDKHSDHWRKSYVDVYKGLVGLPWFPVLGNHDYTGNPAAQLGGYEGTGWWMPARNYIIQGSRFGKPEVDLFMIDVTMWEGGNDFPQALASVKPPAASVAALHRWLPEQLAQSRASIKLVFGHHGIYSVNKHGGTRKHAELEEVLKNGGVTAYIHGHDHCLYHIRDPLLDYVCSGGGSKLYVDDYRGGGYSGCILPEQCPPIDDSKLSRFAAPPADSPRWLAYKERNGFAYFEVTPTRVEFSFIGPEADACYQATIPIRRLPAELAPEPPTYRS
jgi:hypothetical protein